MLLLTKKWYAHGDSTKRRSRCRASRNIRLATPQKSPREKRIIYPLFAAKRQELNKKPPSKFISEGIFVKSMQRTFDSRNRKKKTKKMVRPRGLDKAA